MQVHALLLLPQPVGIAAQTQLQVGVAAQDAGSAEQ
jgi:hypothetical protein